MRSNLKPEIAEKMQESWQLRDRAVELLDLISMEFKSDPMSVQCFDLRIVEESIEVSKKLGDIKKELGDFW